MADKTAKGSKAAAGKGAPPSEAAPVEPSGGSGYAIGAAVFAIAIAALLYSRCSKDEPAPTAAAPPTATAPAAAPEPAPLPDFAPPPPPEEEEDAGPDDAGTGTKTASGGSGKKGASSGGGACGSCGKGVSSGALNSAVAGTAGLARGCYNRALRTGGAEGSLMVSVSVGANGSLCGARITSDSVGNPGISACVLGKFQGRSYPKPKSGCVVINVPISFKMKN